MKKLLVDSVICNEIAEKDGAQLAWQRMKDAVAAGNQLIFTEASWIDNKAILYAVQHEKNKLEAYLTWEDVVIHIYQGRPYNVASGYAAMVSKAFFWSSCGVTTNLEEKGIFSDILEQLPEETRDAYETAYQLAVDYAQAKSEWVIGPWEPKQEFSAEELEKLGLDSKQASNRSLVKAALENSGFPSDRWARYLNDYNHKFVVQHGCDGVFGLD